jgi:hypothetical protein
MPLTPELIAWAAGFIEGDGHIGRNSTSQEVDVTQKQRWPLDRLGELFGGSIYQIHNQGVLKRSYWRWRVTGENARALMHLIYPYLSPEKQSHARSFYP